MNVQKWTVNPFQQNSYLLWDADGTAIFIDAGYYADKELNEVYKFIENKKLTPACILLTHCHLDHTFGARNIAQKYNIQVYAHSLDMFLLQENEFQAAKYGLSPKKAPDDVVLLDKLTKLEFGSFAFDVKHVPGHSPGSIALYSSTLSSVFTGDVLFNGSIGRTDLPKGNFEVLEKSIRENLYTLPAKTVVYAGHGPETSIGEETQFNPFVRNN